MEKLKALHWCRTGSGDSESSKGRYLFHLQTAVAASAAPYGYTLSVWTSGAVASNAEGLPNTLDALLFLAGAVIGFAIIGTIAHGGTTRVLQPRPPRVRLWGGFHLPAVGIAVLGASLVVSIMHGWSAWLLVSLWATSAYLLTIACQFTAADAVNCGPYGQEGGKTKSADTGDKTSLT